MYNRRRRSHFTGGFASDSESTENTDDSDSYLDSESDSDSESETESESESKELVLSVAFHDRSLSHYLQGDNLQNLPHYTISSSDLDNVDGDIIFKTAITFRSDADFERVDGQDVLNKIYLWKTQFNYATVFLLHGDRDEFVYIFSPYEIEDYTDTTTFEPIDDVVYFPPKIDSDQYEIPLPAGGGQAKPRSIFSMFF